MFAHIKTGNPPRCPRPSAGKQKKKMYTCMNTHTRERDRQIQGREFYSSIREKRVMPFVEK